MEFEYIKTVVSDRIGTITLNRPDKRNALNGQLVSELITAFKQMAEEVEVRVIILKAEGKVFSAGADLSYLKKLQSNTYEENLEDSNHLKDLFLKIYTLGKPVIAQVQGHAIAGGCGLASVCDIVVASNKANFGYTEVRIGFVPALVMVFLLRKIGEARTRELLLGGELIDAKTARIFGIVNRICDPKDLESTTLALAHDLVTKNSEDSMSLVKEMMVSIPSMSLAGALDYAAEMNAKARSTEDCKRGLEAFLNKKKIEW